ncbi:MAG: NAD-dependent epimerase [Chitinophagales bacterium]|nr:MAG: NAD-dependent epimerase [Chitinophagales bacterium]
MKQKAVVFGGSGFIGSHVSDALAERGFEVTIFDKRPSPYLREGQHMMVGDILNEAQVEEAITGQDYVFHFAGISDIDEASQRPVDTVKLNVLATVYMLEAARKHHIKRFFFASSSYVYSNAGGFYKNSKQACELFIETYQKQYGLNFTILRYGSLYGTRSDHHNSIYRIIYHALKDKKIVYHGTGEEYRAYIHVKDAAKLTVDTLDEQYANEYLELTGNYPMKYSNLLEMIREMLNNEVEIEYRENRSDTHYRMTPYNFQPRVAKKLTNNPQIDMGQGILELMGDIYHYLYESKEL